MRCRYGWSWLLLCSFAFALISCKSEVGSGPIPVAVAGADQLARVPGAPAVLDGLESYVAGLPEGTLPETMRWTIVVAPESENGQAASIDHPEEARTALHLEKPGLYVVRLDVEHQGMPGAPVYLNVHARRVDPVELIVRAPSLALTYGSEAPALEPSYAGFIEGDLPEDLERAPTCLTEYSAGDPTGTYGTSCEGGLDPRYFFTYEDGELQVEPATLTVSAPSHTIGYGDPAPDLIPGYAGFVLGDDPSALSEAPSCSTAYEGGDPVGSYETICDGGSAADYVIAHETGSLTVEPSPLLITASDQGKTYGDAFAFAGTEFESEGLLEGDSIDTVTLESEGSSNRATVGTYAITASGASGTGLTNYSITYVEGALLVAQRDLTITARDQIKSFGDTLIFDPAGDFTTDTLRPWDSVSSVNLTSAGAGPDADLGTYPIVISGAQGTGLENYSITYIDGTLNVVQRALTIRATNASKTYGEAHIFDESADFTVTGLQGSDSVTSVSLTSAGAAPGADVGSYDLVVSDAIGEGLDSYTINYQTGALLVQPALLGVTAPSQTINFGSPAPPLTPEYAGFVAGDTSDDLGTRPTCTTTYSAGDPVGTYTTRCSGGVSNNYDFEYFTGVLTVQTRTLTVTAPSPTIIYGDPAPSLTPIYDGFSDGEDETDLDVQPSCSTTYSAGDDAGSHATQCAGGASSNYEFVYVDGSLTVERAALVVTAPDDTITYGDAAPALEPAYSGFVGGESATNLDAQPTCATSYSTGDDAGSYPTQCSGGASGNYEFVYEAGTLTAEPAALTVTAPDDTVIYGEAAPSLDPTYQGFVAGDGPVDLDIQPTCSIAYTGGDAVGDYDTVCSGGASGNYVFTYVSGLLTVQPRDLTITADDQTKTEGEAFSFSGTEFQATGLYGTDSVTLVTLTSDGAPASAAPGTYAIIASEAQGTGLANYTILYVDGTMTVTSAAALQVDAGADQSGIFPWDTVHLTGAASGGSTPYTFVWSVTTSPVNDSHRFAVDSGGWPGTLSLSTTGVVDQQPVPFWPRRAGTYVVELAVTDSDGNSASDMVSITVVGFSEITTGGAGTTDPRRDIRSLDIEPVLGSLGAAAGREGHLWFANGTDWVHLPVQCGTFANPRIDGTAITRGGLGWDMRFILAFEDHRIGRIELDGTCANINVSGPLPSGNPKVFGLARNPVNGDVWIATESDITVLPSVNGVIANAVSGHYYFDPPGTDNPYWAMALAHPDSNGIRRLFISEDGPQYFRTDVAGFVAQETARSLTGNSDPIVYMLRGVKAAGQNEMWFATDGSGLFRLPDIESTTGAERFNDSMGTTIESFAQLALDNAGGGDIWAASNAGLIRYKRDVEELVLLLPNEDGLCNAAVQAVAVDDFDLAGRGRRLFVGCSERLYWLHSSP